VPLFFVFVYFFWAIVLFGAEIAFAYQNLELYRREVRGDRAGAAQREAIGLRIVVEIARSFRDSTSPFSADDLSDQLRIPVRAVRAVLAELQSARIVAALDDAEKGGAWQLGRPAERIQVIDVLASLRGGREPSRGDPVISRSVEALLAELAEGESKAAGGQTLADVLTRIPSEDAAPLRDEVVEAMRRVLRDVYGNPSSAHAEGAAARAEVERARERVASLLDAEPDEILLTGGATEANNTVILGVLRARPEPGHVVTSAIEHPSLEAPLAVLEAEGWRVTRVPVGPDGRVDPDAVVAALRPDTALVSVILANNETGVVQPLAAIAAAARERGIPVHSDATQAVGKLPLELRQNPLDLLSLSAHKFNGPKGSGCLVIRGDRTFQPLLHGGPQERGRRGGTENVAGIAGLGAACALAEAELSERIPRYTALRDRLWEGMREKVPGVRRNGTPEHVLCNTLNVEFEDTPGEVLLQALDLEGVAVSAGAACASGSIEPSHVLTAMGLTPQQARGSLRLSVGHGVDEAQIDRVLAILPDLVARVRDAESA
jgi:cysteine desulfurase